MIENTRKIWQRLRGKTNGQVTYRSQPKTKGYESFNHMYWQQPRDLLPFGFAVIFNMLIDPQVRISLAVRSSPLFGTEFAHKEDQSEEVDPMTGQPMPATESWTPGVEAARPEVGVFIQRQLDKVWKHHLHELVKAQIWGWAAGEVTLKLGSSRLIEIDRMEARHARDCRLLLRDGDPAGIQVSRVKGDGKVDLHFPNCFFHNHDPQPGHHYGQSVLLGAYSAWADKWLDGGALDVRRLFCHKDAYGGCDLGYPDGNTYLSEGGEPVPNRDIARQIVEQIRAGNTIVRPSERDPNGNEKWPLTRATVPANPQHILQYPKDLDDEIRRGIGIPDGIIDRESSGGLNDNKDVAQQAFYASLDTWLTSLIQDLTVQIFEHLVLMNFGRAEDFQISHKPLGKQALEKKQPDGQPPGGGMPPGQPPGMDPMGGGDPMAGMMPPGMQGPPQQMSIRSPIQNVAAGTVKAAELVRSVQDVLRLSSTEPETDDTMDAGDVQDQAELIAEILTGIYGDDAEDHFDAVFGGATKKKKISGVEPD